MFNITVQRKECNTFDTAEPTLKRCYSEYQLARFCLLRDIFLKSQISQWFTLRFR